jgi:hypothetical protein
MSEQVQTSDRYRNLVAAAHRDLRNYGASGRGQGAGVALECGHYGAHLAWVLRTTPHAKKHKKDSRQPPVDS